MWCLRTGVHLQEDAKRLTGKSSFPSFFLPERKRKKEKEKEKKERKKEKQGKKKRICTS